MQTGHIRAHAPARRLISEGAPPPAVPSVKCDVDNCQKLATVYVNFNEVYCSEHALETIIGHS